ncbi:glycosyltransferase family protein [Aestuariibacter salexigens]|uniref:glycosyltransferase family protein n=1 Tax=Aestuariibacter salexigens TaxID=226010 RepID=UPI0003F98BF7|nr:glycosyltransferase [Aestuariibacter salexigens]
MNRMIVFGEDWGRHPSSTQHLAKYLSQSKDITWVNSVGMRAPGLNRRDMKRVVDKAYTLIKPSGSNTDGHADINFNVINPAVLPWHNVAAVNAYNTRKVMRAIGPRKSGEKRIYWLSLPTAISMIEIEPEDRVIYYCGDDFMALDGVDRQMIAKWEPKLIARANIIFAASERLVKKMPADKTVLLEHGVDYSLFSTDCAPHPTIKRDRPTVGFYGSISEWVDVGLLTELAQKRREYDIMLVGAVKTDISSLRVLPNVHVISAVEHHQLPSFSQHWQALLIPFKHNQQIAACNPLKLREYLAAGQPIVSTSFPALEKYRDLVSIADDAHGFISAIDNAILHSESLRDQIKRNQRQRVAKHDWSQRACTVTEHINAIM